LSVEKILDAHHTLWRIEESFKIMKSTLEVRPIFHWTEKRIKGHFVVCFMAFLLERTLEVKLKKAEIL
jgi:transposase